MDAAVPAPSEQPPAGSVSGMAMGLQEVWVQQGCEPPQLQRASVIRDPLQA